MTVTIDYLPESACKYNRRGYTVVVIDVIRATTTAITAAALGRRVFPIPSLEMLEPVRSRLEKPLLVGELGGNKPYGFDITNSPHEIARRDDISRPMILLSSSGTQLISAAAGCDQLYLACFRNCIATVSALFQEFPERVAIIGAGTRGEFREEDQMCCAWIAEGLVAGGYQPGGNGTADLIRRWSGAPVAACRVSKSVDYLTRSRQLADLDFVLTHVNDIDEAFVIRDDELVLHALRESPIIN